MRDLVLIAVSLLFFSCSKEILDKTYSIDATGEAAQQVGDAMVSIDESGGSNLGDIAANEKNHAEKTFARLTDDEPVLKSSILNMLLPTAIADNCSTTTFNACSATFQRVRVLSGCTTAAGGTMTGSVTLTYTGTGAATCTAPASGDKITRYPNYDVTGLRGAVFSSIATSATGQTVTRVNSTDFTFANAGVRRTFTTPKAVKILDITSSTSSAITISGIARTGRTISGGGITLVNNLTSLSCTLTPAGISWSANCNCPTAGSFSGTCSDATTLSVLFGGTCGQTTVTKGTDTSTVTMDRCQLN